jgi:tetratricopeptide (TPR) repeat protein
VPIDKNKIIAAAQKYVQRGAFDKAIREYQRLVDDDPKDVRTLLKIGDLHAKKGDLSSAAKTYERVASTYAEQGFYLKAVAVYKQILKVDPAQVEVNRKLAEMYHQLGLLSDSMVQYQTLATTYERQGKIKETIAVCKRMVELDPDNVASRVKLAELYSREGETEEAVREFERVCEQLHRQGRLDDYVKVAERLLYLDPQKTTDARRLAQIYLDRADTRRALAKLQLCFKADPRDLETLRLLSAAFRALGQIPKTVSVLKEMAAIYTERGQTTERDGVWAQVLELAPDDPDARAALSARASVAPPPPAASGPASGEDVAKLLNEIDVYLRYGLFQKAKEQLSRVLRLTPENPEALERLCQVSQQTGDPVGAVGALLRLAEQRRGDSERFREALVRAFQIDPTNAELLRMWREIGEPAPMPMPEPVLVSHLEPEPQAFEEEAEPGGEEIVIIDEGEAADETVFGLPPDLAELPQPSVAGAATERAGSGPDEEEIETLSIEELIEEEPDFFPKEPPGAMPSREEKTDLGATGSLPGPEGPPLERGATRGLEVDRLDERTVVATVEALLSADEADLALGPEAFLAGKELRPRTDAEVESELEEAEFFRQQGLFEEARLILTELARARPQRADIAERLREVEAKIPGAAERAGEAAPVEGSTEIDIEEVFDDLTVCSEAPLGAEDCETHYDLGIAYREMGLYDEAIQEFELARRSPARELAATERIGACYLGKHLYEAAIREFKRGLSSPHLNDASAIEFYFGLGEAYEGLGDEREALYYYRRVAAAMPEFRDTQQRIARLSASTQATGFGGRASTPASAVRER